MPIKECTIENTTNETLQELLQETGDQETALRSFLSSRLSKDVSARDTASSDTTLKSVENRIRHIDFMINRLRSTFTEIEAEEQPLVQAFYQKAIDRLEEDRKALLDDQTPRATREIARKQLDWAEKIAGSDNVSEAELLHAIRLTDIWSLESARDFLTEEQLEKGNVWGDLYIELDGRSQRVQAQVIKRSIDTIRDELQRTLPEEVFNKEVDSMLEMGDINLATRYFLDASKTGNQVIELVDTLLKNARRRSGNALDKYSMQIEEALRGIDAEKLLQTDSDGNFTGRFIGPYSHQYYQRVEEETEKLQKALRRAEDLPSQDARKIRRRALKEYYEAKRKLNVSIDVRFFTDENFQTEEFASKREYKNYLIDQFGQEEAERLIEEAEYKWEDFRYRREMYRQQLNLEILNDSAELKRKEDGSLESPREYLERMMRRFERQNSPKRYLFEKYGEKGDGATDYYAEDAEAFVVEAPRAKIQGEETGYYDRTYQNLSPEERSSLDTIMELMGELKSYLPTHISRHLGPNFLPQVQKNFIETLMSKEGKGVFQYASERMIDAVLSEDVVALREAHQQSNVEIDPTTGREVKDTPILFTDLEDPDNLSRDVGKVMKMFAGMALNYRFMNQVKDQVKVVHRVFESKARELNMKEGKPVKDKNGFKQTFNNSPQNALNMMEYMMDALLYGEKRKTGDLGTLGKVYTTEATIDQEQKEELLESLEDRKENLSEEDYRIERAVILARASASPMEKRRAGKMIETRLLEMERMLDEDEISQSQFDAHADRLDTLFDQLQVRRVDVAKVLDGFIKWTQLKGLGYNLAASMANLGFGFVSNLTHAASNQDFNTQELIKAFGIVLHNTNPWNPKVSNLVRQFDILFEVTEIEYGKGKEREGVKRFKPRMFKDPYFLQRNTEFFIQSVSMVAQMLHKKVTVQDPDTGKDREISLFEAYGKDGFWNEGKWGPKPEDWNPEIRADDHNEFTRFRNKVIQVNKLLHGNYDPNSPVEAKAWVLGRLVTQFRSWIAEGVAWRYQAEYYDQQLGRYVKGRYRSYGALMRKITKGEELSDVDKANMRANLMEIAIASAFMLFGLMLKSALEDDDDDRQGTMLLMNTLYRVNQDIWFYINPVTISEIVRDPLPVMRTFNDFHRAQEATRRHMASDGEWRGESPSYYWARATPLVNQIPKIHWMMNNSMAE